MERVKRGKQATWLHISDLHLRTGDRYNQSVALSSLLKDLSYLVDKEKYHFDLVFITGDIAYSGKHEEYELAKKFIQNLSSATYVQTDRIFCVPGNHDVDRSRLTRFIEESVKNLISRELVSQVIGNSKERGLFTDRYHPYYEFLQATFPWARELACSDLSYTHMLNVNGIQFVIIGLNSAWLASSDADRGSIVIGERQVREAFDIAKIQNSYSRLFIIRCPTWLTLICQMFELY